MPAALLTVCVPAYNQPALLRETLTSLCDQDLAREDFIVAVSDDASPLSLAEVVEEFRDRLPIVYDRNPQNAGHLKNWERASRLTDTPYLSFLSHDDVVAPGHLRRALDALIARPSAVLAASLAICQRHPGAIDSYCHGTFLRGAGTSFIHPYLWDRTEWMALSLTGTPVSIVGAIFQAEAFRKCRHWHDFPLWHDRLMLAEMGLHGDVISMPWIAGYYRVGESQLSAQLWDSHRNELRESTAVVLEMAASAELQVIPFWVDFIASTRADLRPSYLRMLQTAMAPPQFEELRRACERRLGSRLPLTRLERFRVPSAIATLVRGLDRALAKPR